MFSTLLVAIMVIVSVILFSLLVQRLNELQISNVLHVIGDRGRQLMEAMYPRGDDKTADVQQARHDIADSILLGPVTQTLTYSGKPRTIASYDIGVLVREAQKADAVIVMASAVGDTLVENAVILRVYRARTMLPDDRLIGALCLATERTFDQDPKFALRLLVDIA